VVAFWDSLVAMNPFEHASEAPADTDAPPSTGFLPLSLAVVLFVSGLFALGIIPGFSCSSQPAVGASSR
jgi:hypothetical protein